MWNELGVALCLVLIIEGVIPFLAPGRWRKLAVAMTEVDDRVVRGLGLASMLSGTVLLYLVR
ncbi:MAG: DUF2065 family protein [Gammaproteobacteria bacterium]|nr:MAG: DUF2065 family protein [Chloroflexota bacterium]TDJ24213.1 MAG: DUF2065 family protein [Gammaproteobacteria bacterium]TDJ42104.1 MAG: DUF2065 family protein [Gammaproteobacteria bacterium]